MDDAPLLHSQQEKTYPLQVTGLGPAEPTEARDPYLSLQYPGDPFLSGGGPRGLDLQDWGRFTAEGARAASAEAAWALGESQTGRSSGQTRWGGRSDTAEQGGAEGGLLETALGAAYGGLSDGGDDGSRFRIPDTLFLPRQRNSPKGTAVPRSRGLDSADLSVLSASGLLPPASVTADERFAAGWASSLVSGRGGRQRQETQPPAGPPERKWPESSGGQPSQLTLESSPTGVLGGLTGAEFHPPSDEAVTDFLQRWKANFDKWGPDDAPAPGGGIAPAQSAISSNSGTRGESHVSTLRTEPPELSDTLGSRPGLPQPARGMARNFGPGLHRGLETGARQLSVPFPGAQPRPLTNATWRQNPELRGGLFNTPRGGLPLQAHSLAARPLGSDLYPRYYDAGNEILSTSRLSTEQLLLLLESYRRLDQVDPLGGQAPFGGSLETGIRDPQSRRHAEAEQLAAARSLLLENQLGLTSATNPNPALDPSAPLRRGGIAREIQVNTNLPMPLPGFLNLPRSGDPLATGRSNSIFPTTLAMTPNVSFGEHLTQLPSIAPAPTFQHFEFDRPPYQPLHRASTLPFPPNRGDLSGGGYRALGPTPIADSRAPAFAQLEDAGRNALSAQQQRSYALETSATPASSTLWAPASNVRDAGSLPQSRSANSGVATSSELPPEPSGPETENRVPDAWDPRFLGA